MITNLGPCETCGVYQFGHAVAKIKRLEAELAAANKRIAILEGTLTIPAYQRRVSLVQSLRRSVFERDQFRCRYCGTKPQRYNRVIDHIVPVSQGGRNLLENLATSCRRCNHLKGARLLEASGMKLLPIPAQEAA